jgi:hypothetical protein
LHLCGVEIGTRKNAKITRRWDFQRGQARAEAEANEDILAWSTGTTPRRSKKLLDGDVVWKIRRRLKKRANIRMIQSGPNKPWRDSMRVLGIDPSLNTTGYSVLEFAARKPKLVETAVARGDCGHR